MIYPSNAELTEIAQQYIVRTMPQRPVFDIFPMVNEDNYLVMWEQEDNYKGMQQVRGLSGEPPRVTKSGVSRFQLLPGVYGEFELLDELELTIRRQYGSFNQPINVDDLVGRSVRKLLGRRLDRIESIIWTLLTTGTFSVSGPLGAVLHTDSYTQQSFTAAVSWATFATATPLADLRAIQLLARGYGVTFGDGSKIYMNQKTFNNMLSNTNAADLGGRRTAGLGTVNSPAALNVLLMGDNLPQLVIYDYGTLADPAGTFTPFIPDNTAVVVGRRIDGSPIGNYKMVRNANNPGLAPGPYTKVIDRGETTVPRTIEIHDGHTGGPALFFPSAIVKATL